MQKKRNSGGTGVKDLVTKDRIIEEELKDRIKSAAIKPKDKKAILEMLPVYRKLGMNEDKMRHWVQINIAVVMDVAKEDKFINQIK